MTRESGRIVLFDGVCGLCTWSVRFIIRRDSQAIFRFASLQSTVGGRIAQQHGISPSSFDTLVLVEKGVGYVESDAALRIASRLEGIWRIAGLLRVLPRSLRDAAYRGVARQRYHLFGRLDAGWIPPSDIEDRFLHG